MTVGRRLRFEILRRDGYACRYCGGVAPDVQLTVDHVVPVSLGGGDEPNNLVTACADCNSGKASTPADAAIVEDVDATAMLLAKAVEKAAAMRREADEFAEVVEDSFIAAWEDTFGNTDGFPVDWRDSIARFLSLGLTARDLARLIEVTSRKKAWGGYGAWKFFCGCCWRKIGDIQEEARRLIERGEV